MDAALITQPNEHDVEAAAKALVEFNRLLAGGRVDRVEVRTHADSHTAHAIVPPSAFKLLMEILGQMANGNAVTVVPVHAELTTQQAAELLNVSRPHVVKLIEDGRLPARKVGTRRRVRMSDLLEFKKADDAARRRALAKLTAEAQELRLGYDE